VSIGHDRRNNFDAVRLLGALLVLVGHAYPLHGIADNPGVFGFSIETVGLILFFSLSGYLIATSWDRDPRFGAYLAKRSLRIFPGLAAVVLLSMFVLGPLISSLSVNAYFQDPSLWSYAKNIVLSPVYALPGVFQAIPYPNAVNGSLWSLPPEFACYLMVPIVGLLPRPSRSATYVALAVAAGVISALLSTHAIHIVLYGTDLAQATSVWPFFLVGAGIALARKRLPISVEFGLAALFCASIVAAISPLVGSYLWWFVLPYAIIAFGSARSPVISRLGRFGDVSYGIYLYAFVVQQTLIYLVPSMPFRLSVLSTIAVTAVLAFGSWHFIEKPALRLKPRAAQKATNPTSTTQVSDGAAA
jgi:peptidoglycan/LPS O-acetylase OafA/YrhL